MLGDINGGAAILAAERQTLQQAQDDQDYRSGKAYRRIAGQQADYKGRPTHDRDCDQKGILAAGEVADPAEHKGAERA